MGSRKDLAVFTSDVVEQVFERDMGACAWCKRRWLNNHMRGQLGGWDMQHRKARGSGGARNDPGIGSVANAIILCRGCHILVEGNGRAEARELGFSVLRSGIHAPEDVPLRHKLHGWVLLDTNGGWTRCEPPK